VYNAVMRTTIDLRPDLHHRALSISRDKHQSLSETINELIARVLGEPSSATLQRSSATGLTTVRLGTVITADDVRSLDDDE
jgi:hypothetical protein